MFKKEPLTQAFMTAGRMTLGAGITMVPSAISVTKRDEFPQVMGATAVLVAAVIAGFAVRRYNIVERQMENARKTFGPR